ncbi:helix-turn-helix transcriptional regulator [Marinitenerispora sediminis]|uniref:Transcriptional regulator n=1 Tax=Marinitenerispora sediminis TaxID=1931232 RepID=A0A368SYC9_9ACTN|nr:WYL domain-containing protein [Marinitenerispora sediminis]RCV49051.1 transcriptional regulator [Marinitenerispora sediminis]RCV51644.1 transcriptional regulator [Marinitenerispora sediminis]RCV52976.1 transcriptional regulator [Marinitenerispora sediminis]
MTGTTIRLLRLCALLASRPQWTSGELAARLGVSERTVRRDVARLRELGYGVESDPGPWGGYHLGAADRMPPLVLDDEEALAVAVALRDSTLRGVLGDGQAAVSALLKLRQVLPPSVSDRLGEMDSAMVHLPGPPEPQIAADVLLALALACRRGERARLVYQDRRGRTSERGVDPYRLVHTGRRWYFVARDVDKGEWRTFRGDRVRSVDPVGRPVDFTDPPDPGLLVSHARSGARYPVYAVVRLPLPESEARRLIPPSVGAHRPDGADATVVEIGGPDADGLAAYLLGLGTRLRVLAPRSVREALLRRVRALADDNAADGPA